jgi:EAL and modified HD-GYP domain-containing signal transduction protein
VIVEIDDAVVSGAASGRPRGLCDGRLRLTPDAAPLPEMAEDRRLSVLEPSWDEVLEPSSGADRSTSASSPIGRRTQPCCETTDAVRAVPGYHLGRPQTLSMESLGPGQAVALLLLSRLADPAVSAREVEEILRTDPAMTVRLLKIANAANAELA